MNKGAKIDEDTEEGFDFSSFDPGTVLSYKEINPLDNKQNYNNPPDEDYLTNNTLWPEANKLYGHVYEILSVTSNKDGTLLASSAKSQTEKHSKVFIWSLEKNSLVSKLEGHNLSVVQVEFSPSDTFLLSVSRGKFFL